MAGIVLPSRMRVPLERLLQGFLVPEGAAPVDFAQPAGEAALLPPDSVSWQVFKNPVSLAIGGVAAVILELAEPRVRTGVWEHTRFRTAPLPRLQRTGLAAMLTVYGPEGTARTMIAGVRRMHERVQGVTPEGLPYRASDPALLGWVHATATFGFLQAYHTWVRPLDPAEQDRFCVEASVAGRLYGACAPPQSQAELLALLDANAGALQHSPILDEFLCIMRQAPLLPPGLRAAQPLLVRAAVALLPTPLRGQLHLGDAWTPGPVERRLLRSAARLADRLVLRSHPAVQACQRLGLDSGHLYRQGLPTRPAQS